jgi:hypothetical protein
MLASIRPDAWNFPLLLHVLGALLLLGALVLAASALILAWRDGTASLGRLGFRSLVIGVLPAWILMRLGAEWIASKENLTDAKLTWLDIGFTTADTGLLLILVAILLAGLASRRASRDLRAGGLSLASAVLSSVLLIAYLVSVWAMTTKPS